MAINIVIDNILYRKQGIYIGRPSILGNPFKIKYGVSRVDVIARYRTHLWREIQRRDRVWKELCRLREIAIRDGQLILLCYCKQPDREIGCHGDIVKAAIEWMIDSNIK